MFSDIVGNFVDIIGLSYMIIACILIVDIIKKLTLENN